MITIVDANNNQLGFIDKEGTIKLSADIDPQDFVDYSSLGIITTKVNYDKEVDTFSLENAKLVNILYCPM